MISVNWDEMQSGIGALVARFGSLPRHIAKKHLKAAIGRTLRPGVPKLRALTPPVSTRRGRRRKGEKPRSANALRKAVKVKTAYKGRNADGYAYGVIGYKAGLESKKALWLELGTSRISPRRFMQRFYDEYKDVARARLEGELVAALEKAVKELESGLNPTRIYSAGGSWRPG